MDSIVVLHTVFSKGWSTLSQTQLHDNTFSVDLWNPIGQTQAENLTMTFLVEIPVTLQGPMRESIRLPKSSVWVKLLLNDTITSVQVLLMYWLATILVVDKSISTAALTDLEIWLYVISCSETAFPLLNWIGSGW